MQKITSLAEIKSILNSMRWTRSRCPNWIRSSVLEDACNYQPPETKLSALSTAVLFSGVSKCKKGSFPTFTKYIKFSDYLYTNVVTGENALAYFDLVIEPLVQSHLSHSVHSPERDAIEAYFSNLCAMISDGTDSMIGCDVSKTMKSICNSLASIKTKAFATISQDRKAFGWALDCFALVAISKQTTGVYTASSIGQGKGVTGDFLKISFTDFQAGVYSNRFDENGAWQPELVIAALEDNNDAKKVKEAFYAAVEKLRPNVEALSKGVLLNAMYGT